jgi:hypothetical protein
MDARPAPWEFDARTVSAVDQLQSHLQSRLLGKVREFQLLLKDRGLILRGHSHTYYAKQLAQNAFMEAADFPIVANEIEVF